MRVIGPMDELGEARVGALVPTMGALHAGHAALIRHACKFADGRSQPLPVVISIFVNPTQFGPGEDFLRYPRQLEQDIDLAERAGADVVFAPTVEVIYPPGEAIVAPPLPEVATKPRLEDAYRTGHFSGVCQVVARLFDLIQPRFALFGEKDYQQLVVIEAMVAQEEARASRWPELEIVRHPTVREADGLAMSSRNVYLKEDERQRARGLIEALRLAERAAAPGRAVSRIEQQMRAHLIRRGLAVDYAAVRDAQTLMPIDSLDRPARALIAARVGNVRLIDNIPLGSPATPSPRNSWRDPL